MIFTVIKFIALLVFAISCITIYHNTNSYEPSKRVLYIIIGTIVMYGITSAICNMNTEGMVVKSEAALKDTVTVMKLIFTPINSMVVFGVLGNTFGKVKDQVIDMSKAGMRVIILLVVFVLLLIFEVNYIGDFITGLLG